MSHHIDSAARRFDEQVAAVVVAHDGARWIPHLISALEASTIFPDYLVAIDTGSTDGSRELLVDALGSGAVHDTDSTTGFGAAVSTALSRSDGVRPDAPSGGWVWLLHDDCAPSPDALEQLLAVATSDPEIAVVGGRIRAWPRARRLLEVGVTITGTGHRETGVEIGEYDQGQHDEQRDVLAVSSAGMLVRRDVWETLGGFDPALPLFRDDVDFGWRVKRAGHRVVVAPNAIVFHAEAATRGVRTISNTSASPHRGDRRAALFILLANCSPWTFPVQYVRLFIGSLFRSLGYAVGKLPTAAVDELAAAASVLGRPWRIVAARSRRRATANAPPKVVRPLLPRWWTPYLNGIDSLLSRFAEGVRDTATQVAASARRLRSGRGDASSLDSGPVPDEAVNISVGAGPVVWALAHPILTLTAGLTLAAIIASRGQWGSGLLQGGALLPAPDSASAWWHTYTESWHSVRLGSREAASPYVGMLSILGTVLLGKAWLAVDLLMLFAVPLAGIGAYVVARRLVTSVGARVWMAVTYALLPVLTGAVGSGHLGTTVAAVGLPWLVRVAIPLVDNSVAVDGAPGWRPVFATGLVLAGLVAFAPIIWPMAIAAVLVATMWLAMSGRLSSAWGLWVAAGLPVLLLLPWSFRLFADPSLLLMEAGRLDPSTVPAGEQAWQIPLGRLSAVGDAPWWLTVGIILAAVAALLRPDRRGRVAGAWVVLALALGTAAVLAQTVVTAPGTNEQFYAWAGVPVLVAQGAAIVAAGFASDGVNRFIGSGTFGWRQPVAAGTAVLAGLAPVAGIAWWVVTAEHGELSRHQASALPAYMLDAVDAPAQQRILVVRATDDGGTTSNTYTVYSDDGFRLGDESVVTGDGTEGLTGLVTDLLSEGQPEDVTRLADYGIAYVVLPSPADTDQIAQLDGLPGLTRASTNTRQLAGWQVNLPTGLVRLIDPDKALSAKSATVLPAKGGRAREDVEAGSDERVVVVATGSGDGFEAQLDGQDLDAADVDPGTGFSVGSDAGTLEVDPGGHRPWWVLLQTLCLVVAAVFATPSIELRQSPVEEDE